MAAADEHPERPWRVTSTGGRCHGTFAFSDRARARAVTTAKKLNGPTWVHRRLDQRLGVYSDDWERFDPSSAHPAGSATL